MHVLNEDGQGERTLITLYHNPACSKSRGALQLLTERGAECNVVEYLRTPPDRATLHRVLGQLKTAPGELVRRDKRFAELGIEEAACASADQVVEILLEHPELMERPLAVHGERAVIGRPPEKVLELLD